MAATKIHPIKSTLNLAIDYITDAHKTEEQKYVFGFRCSHEFAYVEFDMTKKKFGFTGKNLAYHLIQSFAPGETTPEQAHELGKKLCEKFFGGEYEYVLATHCDKGHIHNHIIINSLNCETGKSFSREHDQKPFPAWQAIRKISDELCRENDLSVIQIPEKGKGKSHYEWERNKAGDSWKAKLKENIDECVMAATSFDDFLWNMKEKGYQIKRGKYISFRASGQERFTRSKTLGWFYREEQLRIRIDRRIAFRLRQEQRAAQAPYKPMQQNERFIAIEGKVADNEGLKRWAMLQNMKNASALINELTEQGIDNQEQLRNRMVDLYDSQLDITRAIKTNEREISNKHLILRKIKTYLSLKPIYAEYKSAKNKERFFREHEDKLHLHDAAKAEVKPLLNANGKLPSIVELEKEIDELGKQKAALTDSYTKIKSEIAEVKKKQKQLEQLDKANYQDKNNEL